MVSRGHPLVLVDILSSRPVFKKKHYLPSLEKHCVYKPLTLPNFRIDSKDTIKEKIPPHLNEIHITQ